MQCLGRSCLVLHHGHTDIVGAGVAAVALLTCEIASGYHPHAPFGPQLLCRDLAAALPGDIQPQEETAGGSFIAVAVTDNPVGEIKFFRIELPVFFYVRL